MACIVNWHIVYSTDDDRSNCAIAGLLASAPERLSRLSVGPVVVQFLGALLHPLCAAGRDRASFSLRRSQGVGAERVGALAIWAIPGGGSLTVNATSGRSVQAAIARSREMASTGLQPSTWMNPSMWNRFCMLLTRSKLLRDRAPERPIA
jgi:hypothetical protein